MNYLTVKNLCVDIAVPCTVLMASAVFHKCEAKVENCCMPVTLTYVHVYIYIHIYHFNHSRNKSEPSFHCTLSICFY